MHVILDITTLSISSFYLGYYLQQYIRFAASANNHERFVVVYADAVILSNAASTRDAGQDKDKLSSSLWASTGAFDANATR